MPKFGTYEERRFPTAVTKLKSDMYTQIGDLKIDAWKTPEPIPFSQRQNGAHHSFKVGDKWGNLWDCAWFHFTGRIPESAAGKHIILLLDINGEMCVFNETGDPVRGLTNMGSTFDPKLGSAGKHVLQITPSAKGNEPISVWIDAGCNDLFGNLIEDGKIKEAGIAICHDDIRDLYYDVEFALDLLNSLPEKSAQRAQLAEALSQVTRLVWSTDPDRMTKSAAILQPQLAKKGGTPSLQISATGHAHIDLAWLWPIRETIRKGARTFSTALDLMDRYPDYVFGASQPQLFKWMKEHYPALYERIKIAVKAGRFEIQGAMWVEADTNVSSGEGLVRQVLYGKRFFQQEFGIDVTNLWLPDVFGYSAALPQILKKAGVDIFMTQKLSWNQVNKLPHHSFQWEGIDGSTILAHMLPEDTYASQAL
ncbi:alpha-mannosidase, partial [bacterium]|nr:alpha-mannosidase [bacterium]